MTDKMDRAYIDQVYEFKGQWDAPSLCGLKIVRGAEKTVVIASELYDRNPGTSVTAFCAPLATLICRHFTIAPETLVFIEHCPDRGSNLVAYQETFHVVALEWDGEKFMNPVWTRITKAEVDDWLR
jgi:hypothetical protein